MSAMESMIEQLLLKKGEVDSGVGCPASLSYFMAVLHS